MATTEYDVTGMTCSHCEQSVISEVSKLAGVRQVTAEAGTGRLVVTAAEPVPTSAVVEVVEQAGYQAVPRGGEAVG